MTAPNLPTNQASAIGELWRRVQILEAVPSGGGDYVFLQETVADGTSDTMELLAVSASYRHLVAELTGASFYEVPNDATPALAPADLQLGWGTADHGDYFPDDYMWGQGWVGDPPDTWEAEDDTFEDAFIPLRELIPAANVSGAGSGPRSWCSATFRFPYYSYVGPMKTVLWEAQAQVQVEGATGAGASTNTLNTFTVGGGNNAFDGEVIDRIRFVNPQDYWVEGSRVSLYGIR